MSRLDGMSRESFLTAVVRSSKPHFVSGHSCYIFVQKTSCVRRVRNLASLCPQRDRNPCSPPPAVPADGPGSPKRQNSPLANHRRSSLRAACAPFAPPPPRPPLLPLRARRQCPRPPAPASTEPPRSPPHPPPQAAWTISRSVALPGSASTYWASTAPPASKEASGP